MVKIPFRFIILSVDIYTCSRDYWMQNNQTDALFTGVEFRLSLYKKMDRAAWNNTL
jgi:hypothetical protein